MRSNPQVPRHSVSIGPPGIPGDAADTMVVVRQEEKASLPRIRQSRIETQSLQKFFHLQLIPPAQRTKIRKIVAFPFCFAHQ